MTVPAHIAGGYLILHFADIINPSLELSKNSVLLVGLVGSVAPDIDFIFFKYIKDHHDSWPHSPLFWLTIYLVFLLITNILNFEHIGKYGNAMMIGLFSHFLFDWFSGRTAGIRFLYPFLKHSYSLFPLKPEKGKVQTSLLPNKEHGEFFKFYAQNKFLLYSEIVLTLSGTLLFLLKLVQQ